MKNLDRDGKPIKSGDKATFDGEQLMGQPWIEHGTLRYDRSRNCWMFVSDEGNTHGAVTEYKIGERIFKYYRREA